MSTSMRLSLLFVVFWAAIFTYSNVDSLSNLLLYNAMVQLPFFILVACIPYLITGRMSYVDIAWPFGIAIIGAFILIMGDGNLYRKTIIGVIYLFIGLRMGIGAIGMGKATGVIFKTEFPRYVYAKMLFEKEGVKNIKFRTIVEIMFQGFANISVLALPGFIISSNTSDSISLIEIIGISIFVVAYILESIADVQKMVFIYKNKDGVCNVGLWKYSRHPNYFSEWLVWSGIVIAALPSWFALYNVETLPIWIIMGVAMFSASILMYVTLVYFTGVKPSEYYSALKRKGYKDYQKTTSMFFPWFPKKQQ